MLTVRLARGDGGTLVEVRSAPVGGQFIVVLLVVLGGVGLALAGFVRVLLGVTGGHTTEGLITFGVLLAGFALLVLFSAASNVEDDDYLQSVLATLLPPVSAQ
jgi:hypothetical protein